MNDMTQCARQGNTIEQTLPLCGVLVSAKVGNDPQHSNQGTGRVFELVLEIAELHFQRAKPETLNERR